MRLGSKCKGRRVWDTNQVQTLTSLWCNVTIGRGMGYNILSRVCRICQYSSSHGGICAPKGRTYIQTYHTIKQRISGGVRASHRLHQIIQTSKIMFRWLPVGHNWLKCNIDLHKCPCYGQQTETFAHLLSCKSDIMMVTRHSTYLNIQMNLTAVTLPVSF